MITDEQRDETIQEFYELAGVVNPVLAQFYRDAAKDRQFVEMAAVADSPRPEVWRVGIQYVIPELWDIQRECERLNHRLINHIGGRIRTNSAAIRELIRGRGLQESEPARANYVELGLSLLGDDVRDRQLLLIELGAAAGLVLSELRSETLDAAMVGIDTHPLSVTNDEDMRWLRAHPIPRSDSRERLDAAIERAKPDPPLVVRGDGMTSVFETIERLRADHTISPATPIILVHSFALAHLPRTDREQLLAFATQPDTAQHFRIGIEPVGLFPSAQNNVQLVATQNDFTARASVLIIDSPQRGAAFVAAGDNTGTLIRAVDTSTVVNQLIQFPPGTPATRRGGLSHREAGLR